MTNPSADDVAIAIVAACRETGDDPVCVAEGIWSHMKARHYAMHALIHVFPKASREKIAGYVGGHRPKQFLANSYTAILGTSGKRQRARWWNDEAYDRVIRAIEADRTRRAVTPTTETPDLEPEQVEIKPGDLIDHPTYGAGRVISIGQWNERRRDYPLSIDFKGRTQVMYAKVVATFRKAEEPAALPSKPRQFTCARGESCPCEDDAEKATCRFAREIVGGETTVAVSSYVEPPAYPPRPLPPAPPPKATCIECGKPCSEFSKRCRDCYRGTPRERFDEELDDRPIMDRGGQFSERRPYDAPAPQSKADLQEELRRAAANTKPRADE